jgi:hypothetical protein
MRWKLIVYWIATIVVAGEQLAGGLTDLIHGGTSVVSGPSALQGATKPDGSIHPNHLHNHTA